MEEKKDVVGERTYCTADDCHSSGIYVVVYIFVVIRDKINRKKAETGEDRQQVWGILEKSVPEIAKYTRAYACWEWSTYEYKKTITKYWHYGIAFNDERICIVPLSCEGGDISYSGGFRIEKSDVGIVNSKKGKNWVELYDRNQVEMISLMIFPENLNDDRFHPVNIIQKEEEAAFIQWKDRWMDEVNGANGVEVTGKMKKPVKNK